ncbi:MAG: TonB-dependent receptor [Acetobacter persici]
MIHSSFSRLRPGFRLLLLAAVSAYPGTVLAQTETNSKHHTQPARPAPATRPVVRQPAAPHMNNRAAAKEQPDTLESITVSAERRQQSTHDVANSVTVLSGKFLQKINAQSYSDYIAQIPGATFNQSLPGLSTITFRGIATTAGIDQGQGTTGYFLNDIPLSEPGFAIAVPDIDTFDVARVEALRGPQSTLFGSATLGGAIDYIPNQADTSKIDAAAQSSIVGMPGHEVGYGEKGMFNIPIIKGKLAVRGVLGYRQDPGYITNLGIGRNTNTGYTRNARASVVYTPTDADKIAYTYIAQSSDISDDPYSLAALPDYQKQRHIEEPLRTQIQMHELRYDHDFSFATLSAMGAFTRKGKNATTDYTPYYGDTMGGGNTTLNETGDSKSMYYELRLASSKHSRFNWLIGAAYYETWKRIEDNVMTDNVQSFISGLYGASLVPQLTQGDSWYWGTANYDGTEKSIFGEASYEIFKGLTLTGGARVFNASEKTSSETPGYLAYSSNGSLLNRTASSTSQTSALPKVALRYEPNKQMMFYFLFSEGYRFGTPNSTIYNAAYPTPRGTRSDTLKNYEVGARLNLFHHHLLIEPTLYWIDWSNMQARLLRPDGLTYGANVGASVSRGAELSATWITPIKGLQLRINGTYDDAHTTQSVSTSGGVIPSGSQLASSPKWQFSEILSYAAVDLPHEPTLSIIHHYRGSAPGLLGNSMRIGNYNTVDFQLTGHFHVPKGQLDLSLYAKNVGNSHGLSMGYDNGSALVNQYYFIPPQSVGMTLNWHL